MCPNQIATKIVYSQTFDPWYNLALEEYLFDRVHPQEVILYLWQNQNTVVIGRNQNPWKECRCKELEMDGGKLARRLSGGGAVFHDLGNLNFTFITHQKLYDVEKQLKVILEAVKKLGIHAEFSGRNDLTVDGSKFSGNAFYFRENSAYHHGTILVDVDFNKLTNYLQVSKEKIASKGIESVRARVVNLKSLEESLTIEKIKEKFRETFEEIYGGPVEEVQVHKDNEEFAKLYDKYASWEWRYGESPTFDITLQHRFPWGEIDMGLSLRKGAIQSAIIYSDAMNSDLIQSIASSFKGLIFKTDDMIAALGELSVHGEDKKVIEDIQNWLLEKSKEL